jgi:hypothetical protein
MWPGLLLSGRWKGITDSTTLTFQEAGPWWAWPQQ